MINLPLTAFKFNYFRMVRTLNKYTEIIIVLKIPLVSKLMLEYGARMRLT